MKFFKDELKKIRAFVFDVDGVLSHQSQNLTPDGELIRTSCTKDGYAIMYAIRKGYIIAVISGGGAPGVRERLEKLGVRPEDIYLKVANKTEALAEIEQRYSLDKEAIMYMGDDIPDLPVLQLVGLSCAPADAVDTVLKSVDFVSSRAGGRGAVREMAEKILMSQGVWDDLIDRFYFHPDAPRFR